MKMEAFDQFQFYQNYRQRYTVIPITTVRGPLIILYVIVSLTILQVKMTDMDRHSDGKLVIYMSQCQNSSNFERSKRKYTNEKK